MEFRGRGFQGFWSLGIGFRGPRMSVLIRESEQPKAHARSYSQSLPHTLTVSLAHTLPLTLPSLPPSLPSPLSLHDHTRSQDQRHCAREVGTNRGVSCSAGLRANGLLGIRACCLHVVARCSGLPLAFRQWGSWDCSLEVLLACVLAGVR